MSVGFAYAKGELLSVSYFEEISSFFVAVDYDVAFKSVFGNVVYSLFCGSVRSVRFGGEQQFAVGSIKLSHESFVDFFDYPLAAVFLSEAELSFGGT